MPYLALYRKYRPQTFEEVYGQRAVIRTLENAFRENKIGHAYLFCGPRGTGKTSMARLFAKALNCSEGFGKQCCKCESCRAIASGNHPDVIEMDAASNSSVDDVRGIISQVDYQPIMGRYRVYIIDEVHNMSSSAFNALLKTLEEPPENVVFILCTTEPNKVLPTIISRVQRFDFSRLSDNDLIEDMNHVLKAENVEADPEAIRKIASLADGGVRDALSLLDQAISFSGDHITLKAVEDLFGLVDPQTLCDLLNLALDGKVSDLVRKARGLVERGMDISRATRDMAGICRDLLLVLSGGDPSMASNLTPELISRMSGFSVSDCNRFLSILVKGQRDYRYSVDLADAFEILLLQMASGKAMAQEVQNTAVTAVSAPAAASRPRATPKPAPTPTKESVREVSAAEILGRAVEEPKVDQKPEGEVKAQSAEKPDIEEVKKPEAAEPKPSFPVRSKGSGIPLDKIIEVMNNGAKALKKKAQEGWSSMFGDDLQTLSVLKKGTPVVCSPKVILISVPVSAYCSRINSESSREKVSRIVKENFNVDVQVGAITEDEYRKAVEEFKVRMQSKTLPPKGDVVLYGEGVETTKVEAKPEKQVESKPEVKSETKSNPKNKAIEKSKESPEAKPQETDKKEEKISSAARFLAGLKGGL